MSVAELRQPERLTTRGSLPSARRIVVKIGSSSLTDDRGGLDQDRIRAIADTAAELAEQGTELVIGPSGPPWDRWGCPSGRPRSRCSRRRRASARRCWPPPGRAPSPGTAGPPGRCC